MAKDFRIVWRILWLLAATGGALPGTAHPGPRAVARDPAAEATPRAAPQTADRAYYERALLLAADDKCALLTPDLHRALRVSEAQARGAALRAGLQEAGLAQIAGNAKRAIGALACSDPEITTRAARARNAFAQFRIQKAEDFPGNQRVWRARRIAPLAGWALVQDLAGRAQFGLWRAAGPDAPARFVFSVPIAAGESAPIAAKLILRDRTTRAAPILSGAGVITAADAPGLVAPPPAFTTTLWARERLADSDAPLGRIGFAFGTEAGQLLSGLDPREAVILRLDDAAGRKRDFLVDVGDFAAAFAFVTG